MAVDTKHFDTAIAEPEQQRIRCLANMEATANKIREAYPEYLAQVVDELKQFWTLRNPEVIEAMSNEKVGEFKTEIKNLKASLPTLVNAVLQYPHLWIHQSDGKPLHVFHESDYELEPADSRRNQPLEPPEKLREPQGKVRVEFGKILTKFGFHVGQNNHTLGAKIHITDKLANAFGEYHSFYRQLFSLNKLIADTKGKRATEIAKDRMAD